MCKDPRIHSHKVFAGLAKPGKTSTGGFFGFNDLGELLNPVLTPENIDDRKPIPRLVCKLFGKLFVDKGYLSRKLFEELLGTFQIQLITGIRADMKNILSH